MYATWKGQTVTDKDNQANSMFSVDAGKHGYLREAYHGHPYATPVLVPELWEDDADAFEGVKIPAKVLRERLDATLATAIERQVKVYQSQPDDEDTKMVCDSFKEFVALCERMEAQTGEPCRIWASY